MKLNSVSISSIKIRSGRLRSRPGDVRDLMSSIERVGLLHPIVITDDNVLISGRRRLEAFKRLGIGEIPAVIVNKDLFNHRQAEVDENEVRVNLSTEDRLRMADYLTEPEQKAANKRQLAGGERGKEGGRGKKKTLRENFPEGNEHRARDAIAAAVGWSGRTLEKAQAVVGAAKKDPAVKPIADEMLRTGKVDPAHKKLLAVQENKRPVREPKVDKSPVLANLKRLYLVCNARLKRSFRKWLETVD